MLKASLTCLQAPPSRTQHHGDLGADPRGDLSHTVALPQNHPTMCNFQLLWGPSPEPRNLSVGVPSRLPRQASTLLSGVWP